MPGIGPTISLAIMAQLPELGALTGNKVAALVGVAPITGIVAAPRAKAPFVAAQLS